MFINYNDLEWCCGITVVGDFGATDQTSGDNEYPIGKIRLAEELKTVEKASYTSSMMIATLNDEQYKEYFPIFKKQGWSCVRKGINGLHNSTNYLLVKVLKPVK